jgi:hypothetical protein
MPLHGKAKKAKELPSGPMVWLLILDHKFFFIMKLATRHCQNLFTNFKI